MVDVDRLRFVFFCAAQRRFLCCPKLCASSLQLQLLPSHFLFSFHESSRLLNLHPLSEKMSSDLTWLLTRTNSSFLVKRNGLQLSRESGNLRNLHSFKFSGVSAAKSIHVAAANKGVAVTLKKSASAKKPATSTVSVVLSGPISRSARSLKNLTTSYRGDLVSAALARASRILESKKTPKTLKPRAPRGVRAKKL
ncbi:hypothetical protein BASA50_005365 [Batrachochytrium salamandrivorans]|uniref:Ribosomal eL28/Mak16 domain-containing protein n=1 Tax=Batrachochytrium salamandrivorans TaxID=1357716 RepID=A0ABQ8FFM1_9FUNG|nr:hypothetical protein BASA50_005365 [Batrachochytrium salamandrivorans]